MEERVKNVMFFAVAALVAPAIFARHNPWAWALGGTVSLVLSHLGGFWDGLARGRHLAALEADKKLALQELEKRESEAAIRLQNFNQAMDVVQQFGYEKANDLIPYDKNGYGQIGFDEWLEWKKEMKQS